MSFENSPQETTKPEMIKVPEELKINDTLERGVDAQEVHVDLGAQAIAQARILERNRQFEQASAEAVHAAKNSPYKTQ